MAKKFRIKGDQDISKIAPFKILETIRDGKYLYYPSKPPEQNALYITNLSKKSVTGNFIDEASKIKRFDLNNRKQFKEFRNLANKYRNDENIYVPDYVFKVIEGQSKRLGNKLKHSNFRIKSGNRTDIRRNSPIQIHVEPNKEMSINAGWTDNDGFIGINGVINPNSPENNHLEAHYSNSGKFESFNFRENGKELEFDNLLKKDYDNGRDLPDLMINRIKRREKNGGFKISSNSEQKLVSDKSTISINSKETVNNTLKKGTGRYRIKGNKGLQDIKNIADIVASINTENGTTMHIGGNGNISMEGFANTAGVDEYLHGVLKGGHYDFTDEYNNIQFNNIIKDAYENYNERIPDWALRRAGIKKGKLKAVKPENIKTFFKSSNQPTNNRPTRRTTRQLEDGSIDYLFNDKKYKNIFTDEYGNQLIQYYNKNGESYLTERKFIDGTSDTIRTLDKEGRKFPIHENEYRKISRYKDGSLMIKRGEYSIYTGLNKVSRIRFDKNGVRQRGYNQKWADNGGDDWYYNGEKYKNVLETEDGTVITQYYNKNGENYATYYDYDNGDFSRNYRDKNGNDKSISIHKNDDGSIKIENGIKKGIYDEEAAEEVVANSPYYANNGKIEDETVGLRKLDEAINGKRVIVTGADRPDIMNSKPNSQKITTTIANNKDGTSSKFIQIGDSAIIEVDTDADGNIIKKMYGAYENGSVTNGYAINYDKDGNVVKEGFHQDNKWTNVVEYDKDLKPIATFTDPDLDIDKAKALKEEADKAWKRFGYEGISDILPDFHYKPIPEPKSKPKSAEDIFNDKLEEIEKLYSEGKLSDDEYADALNKLYNKERQTKKTKTKSKITPNKNAYDSPLDTAPSKDSYELQMNKYDYYASEYEKMKDFVDNYNPTGKDAEALAKDAKKIEDFFGKDKYSAEEARLKYEEAKLYGRHRDNPDDPLRRGSKAWWDKRDELMKQRRALNKNRQEFINSEKAAKELEDSKFIREVAMHRDIRDLVKTSSPTYLSDADVARTIQNSVDWLEDEDNINRYKSIPQEFRDKIEGDIKKEKFEINKERRNTKLDADYEKFKSEYEKLTLSQKDEQNRLRELESKYRKWKMSNVKGKNQKEPAIVDYIKQSREKISDLKKERKAVKKNMKRTSRKTRDRASNIKEEIKNIKNQLSDNEMFDVIQEAYQKELKANPSLTFEQYLKDNYKNTRFENFNPKQPHEIEQLKNDLQFHKDLLKEQSGIDIAEEEGDIVERVFGKLKKASKVDLAMSGISAIGKYKDSRKEGRGVISSTTRAGVDFAASQLMGPALYMGLTAARVAPKLAVNGAMYLQNEVRQMNTASRFRVFGDASFQDNDNLATMRQSGMELAKMANYNLEQTLMGNEARYLHR